MSEVIFKQVALLSSVGTPAATVSILLCQRATPNLTNVQHTTLDQFVSRRHSQILPLHNESFSLHPRVYPTPNKA